MSKVGIYSEPSGGAIGGSEIMVAILAEAITGLHEVDLLHHRVDLTLDHLAQVSGTKLGSARLRYVAPDPYPFGNSHNPWRRYCEARSWHATLSKPYDLFINFTHHVPPFCHAFHGVLVVLFPLDERPYKQSQQNTEEGNESYLAALGKRKYHEWEWKKRMNSYQQRISISQFTKIWVQQRWATQSEVIYPPVDTDFDPVEKTNTILSVGRFATEGHSKNQLEMMSAFQDLIRDGLQGWKYFCVGGLGDSRSDVEYFERVLSLGTKCGAEVVANGKRRSLRILYEKAKIFWHAAGYGVSQHQPELLEHFGLVTVEAMAAGCIPIVFKNGGQTEIVEHGLNGFLWNTLDELKAYTVLVAKDEALRVRLSASARARAQLFSKSRFLKQFRRLLAL
jgi:glycosyltransferase involved in cell wall biosynthesis